MNKYIKKQSKAFTLLEILLVITLIGILASILLVAINPNRQISQSRNLVRTVDINNIYIALQQYNAVNKGSLNLNISNNYTEICDTGTLTIEDSLPNTNYCDGKIDLRILVPTYLIEIPKDTDTSVGGTGYELAKGSSNQISLRSNKEDLSQIVVINPLKLTPEELIQAQITAGTLVPTGTQQLVLNRLVYKNNSGNQIYIDPATTTKLCPAGYIPVPGSSMYVTTDFCVMKYEAKAVATIDPTVGLTTPNTGSNTIANSTTATTSANGRAVASVASGFPIANISQIDSITYCSNSGASLISNAEWMTIARNIEAQGVNWTGGTVGSGGLWRGHSDNSPAGALEASTDNDPYFGTGNTSPSIERRTHTLSNGEVIWDLSGNVWEWTNDTIQGQNKPNTSSGNFFQNWTVFNTGGSYGTLSYDLTRPSNSIWNSGQNMGQYYSGTVNGDVNFTFLRGGNWGHTINAGIFTMGLLNISTSSSNSRGFRCVIF